MVGAKRRPSETGKVNDRLSTEGRQTIIIN